MKRIKIKKSTQQIAADILTSFALCSSADDIKRVSERLMAKYGLCKDSFTGFPCTPKEYRKSQSHNGKEQCVICGKTIPEGQQVCPDCQSDAWLKSKKEGLI